jgi:hypothetical protein
MVCIGDFWAASEGLDDLIIRIGRMISYQEYNTKSPLNGLAAKWAAQNASLLPIDARNIAPPLKDGKAPAGQPVGGEAAAPADSNGGAVGGTDADVGATIVGAPVVSQSEVPVAAPMVYVAPPDELQADPWSQKISID